MGSNYSYAKSGEKSSRVDIGIIILNVLKSWWVILIGCMITAMISYIFVTERYVPEYRASATFVVSTKSSTSTTVYSNLVAANQLANSFTHVLSSPVMHKKIAEYLGNPYFDGKVSAAVVEQTNLIEISVTARSPKLAFEQINAIINEHHLISENVVGNVALDVLSAPTVPTTPVVGMQRMTKVIKHTAIAALAIITAIVIFTIASDTVMSEMDIESAVDCELLSTIRHERKNLSLGSRMHRRARISMLITNPTTSFRYVETFGLLRTRLEYTMKKHGYKALMISSVLEREGKSTVAANIALTLALNHNKVLLIDADMLNPAQYKLLGTRVLRSATIDKVIFDSGDLSDIPKQHGVPNLSLLLGKRQVADSAERIGSVEMRKFMENAKKYFDYIVIDTPPIVCAADAEIMAENAEASLMVVKQGSARAKHINDCIDALRRSGTDVLGCIFNNVYKFELFSTLMYGAKYDTNYRRSGYGYGKNGYGNSEYAYGSGESSVTAIDQVEVANDKR